MRRIGEYTEDDATSWVERQTPVGLIAKAGGAVLALALIVGVIGFVGSWFNEAGKVISAQNVKAQWQFAYDADAGLEQIATQWCTMAKAEIAEINPDYKVQRTSQRLAVETNYASKAAAYNGRLADAFRAKLVAPPDVPDKAPLLSEKTARLCEGVSP